MTHPHHGIEPVVERVLEALEELRRIGADAQGGTTRLAYTEADMHARAWLTRRLQEAGFRVEVDALGNVFGWFPTDVDGEPVLIGSHLDTVSRGGHLDGALGVIAGLEILRHLHEKRWHPATSLAVISLACEEGSRFGMSSIGSRALVGRLSQDDLERVKDRNGVTLRAALIEAGLAPDAFAHLQRAPRWFRAYLEAHIDQGPELEEAGSPVAVVGAIAGTARYRVTFDGGQAHAGAARMGRRRDAMTAAADLILIAEAEATARGDEVVATVGTLEVTPGIVNVVPGQVVVGLELRAASTEAGDALEKVLRVRAEERAAARGVSMRWEVLSCSHPAVLDPRIRRMLVGICAKAGIRVGETVSWPSHDALYLADQGPTGMLLVRNPGKVSHHPDEAMRPADLALVLGVLEEAIVRLAGSEAFGSLAGS